MEKNSEAIMPFINWLESKNLLLDYLIRFLDSKIKLKENHHKITTDIFTKENAKKYIINELLKELNVNDKYYFLKFMSRSVHRDADHEYYKLYEEWKKYVDENLYDANTNIDPKEAFRIFLEDNDCMEKFIVNFARRHNYSYSIKPIDIIKRDVANGKLTYDSIMEYDHAINLIQSGAEYYGSFINNSFTWSETPEGHAYWRKKDSDLNKYFKNAIDLRWR